MLLFSLRVRSERRRSNALTRTHGHAYGLCGHCAQSVSQAKHEQWSAQTAHGWFCVDARCRKANAFRSEKICVLSPKSLRAYVELCLRLLIMPLASISRVFNHGNFDFVLKRCRAVMLCASNCWLFLPTSMQRFVCPQQRHDKPRRAAVWLVVARDFPNFGFKSAGKI